MELDKNIEQELAELLANPEKVSAQHTAMLNELLQEYPYYQPLHLLLAKAGQHTEENTHLTKAAVYTSGQTLHNFLFERKFPAQDLQEAPAGESLEETEDSEATAMPEVAAIPEVTDEETETPTATALASEESATPDLTAIPEAADEETETPPEPDSDGEETGIQEETAKAPEETEEGIQEIQTSQEVEGSEETEIAQAEELQETAEVTDDTETSAPELISTPEPENDPEQKNSTTPEDDLTPESDTAAKDPIEEITAVTEVTDEPEISSAGIADEQETFEEITEISTVGADQTETSAAVQQIPEEEVFEEITELNFNNYRPFRNSGQEDLSGKEPQQQENTERKNSLEDNFVFESIVSSDFFAFEDNFSTEETAVLQEKPEVNPPFIEEHNEAAAAEVENSQLSNYHDEKLPYTFLWWLAKTRKEHQNIFQPYVSPKKGGSQELQQQYVEHIFHMQSHLTGNEALLDAAEQSKPASKDFEIIESFIRNDPQITPPNAEQIDNENKAKKSAEDQNDLVSETLANIYIEQMLYDKAIETYEKLSLKFPEKSRYFADLIQSIEKKI